MGTEASPGEDNLWIVRRKSLGPFHTDYASASGGRRKGCESIIDLGSAIYSTAQHLCVNWRGLSACDSLPQRMGPRGIAHLAAIECASFFMRAGDVPDINSPPTLASMPEHDLVPCWNRAQRIRAILFGHALRPTRLGDGTVQGCSLTLSSHMLRSSIIA